MVFHFQMAEAEKTARRATVETDQNEKQKNQQNEVALGAIQLPELLRQHFSLNISPVGAYITSQFTVSG